MSRLMTRIEKASARVVKRIRNELVFGTIRVRAASAATTVRTLTRGIAMLRLLSPEQSGRFDGQDHRHRRVEREIGDLGEQRLAEVVGEADQQRTDGGAAEAAHA